VRFLLSLSLIFSTQLFANQPENCKKLQKEYQTKLKSLDYSCKVDKDCKEVSLHYNSCAGDIAVSKTVPATEIQSTSKLRDRVRNVCKYVFPPCPAIMMKAFCNKARCDQKEGMVIRHASELQNPKSSK